MFATTILGYTLSAMWTLFWVMFAFILFLFIAFWPATIAKNKGRSFWLWFIMSIFFWWITFILALLIKDNSTTTPATETTTKTE